MPEVDVYNMQGEKTDRLTLSDAVFGAPPNLAVLHQTIVAQSANRRQGTANTRTRGEVSGGGKKPWRQKGTGRARHGSRRAPDFRGGGTVYGPKPRSYRQRIPRKVRREALRSALVLRVQEQELLVLSEFQIPEPKTKRVAELLSALSLTGRTLIVATELDEPTRLSVRNLPRTRTVLAPQLSALDVMNCDAVLATREAVTALEGRFADV